MKEKIVWQLVPLHNHCANAAERAIQNFKHHFKACLAIIDPDFPLREWDRLLVQTEETMNLLRFAQVTPKLSAYAYLFGNFYYNKTPLVSPGTSNLVHTKVEKEQLGKSTVSQDGILAHLWNTFVVSKFFFTNQSRKK